MPNDEAVIDKTSDKRRATGGERRATSPLPGGNCTAAFITGSFTGRIHAMGLWRLLCLL